MKIKFGKHYITVDKDIFLKWQKAGKLIRNISGWELNKNTKK